MKVEAQYLSKKGKDVVVNTNFNAANADFIRAGRLARSNKKEDQEKLKELENTKMYAEIDKGEDE